GRHRQAAGLAAGAEDRVARGELGALQAHRAVVAGDARDGAPERQLAARAAHVVGHRPRHRAEVDDPGVGRVQAGDACAVRLELADLLGAQAAQARHLVGAAAALELVEARELALVQGDDDLAAALDGDAALVAVVVQARGALDAQARLERARLVVDAGVDDPGVVPGLAAADLVGRIDHG